MRGDGHHNNRAGYDSVSGGASKEFFPYKPGVLRMRHEGLRVTLFLCEEERDER